MIIQIDDACPAVRAMRLAIALGGDFSKPNSIAIPDDTRLQDFANKCRDLDVLLDPRDRVGGFVLKPADHSLRGDFIPRP